MTMTSSLPFLSNDFYQNLPTLERVQGTVLHHEILNMSHIKPVLQEELKQEKWLQAPSKQSYKLASVLIPLIERDGKLSVILTKRAVHLRHHPGQISFPGGAYDESDANLLQTALRETDEEMSIKPKDIEVLGVLKPHHTSSGFEVWPFVGIVSPQVIYQANPNEVAEIFEIPLAYVLDPRHVVIKEVLLPQLNEKRRFYAFTYENEISSYFIWGATASILRDFYHSLAIKPL